MFAALEFTKLTLVHDLAAIMLVAGFTAVIFHYLGWPKVIGYMLAGVLIGLKPIEPFLISNRGSIDVLANLGVLFLMFTLGLELNIRRLKKIGGIIFPTAAIDLFLMICAGYAVGHYIFKWGMLPSLFLGAVICDSSTTLLAKSLEEIGCAKARFANVLFGTTISEDILTVGIMALLSGFVITGKFQASELALQLLYITLFLIGVMILGLLFLPKYLEKLSKTCDNETILLVILGVCFGIAFIAEDLQFNLALGAFLIGAVVSESSISLKVHERTAALRSMFSTVFFVTIGLMVDLRQIWQCKWEILLLSVIVVVCKTINCTFGSFIFGQPRRDALRTGIGLAQIGDFAYMVALLGITQTNGEEPYVKMYQIAVGVSIITTLLNPFLLRSSQSIIDLIDRKLPLSIQNWMDRWTETARNTGASARKGLFGPEFKHAVILYIVDLALIAVLFIIGHYLIHLDYIWDSMPRWISGNIDIVIWFLCCVVALPFMLSAYMHQRKMAILISMATVPAMFNERWAYYIRQFSYLVHEALGIGTIVMETALLSFSLFPDWHIILSIMIVFIAIAAVFMRIFWKQVKERTQMGQAIIMNILESNEEEIEKSISTYIFTKVTVPESSGAIGMTLAELRLPNRTGASIAKITRLDGTSIETPGAKERIHSGDTLELNATQAQHEKTVQLLSQKEIPRDSAASLSIMLELKIQSVTLAEENYAIGKSLMELRLRNITGATVVRITYPDNSLVENPAPDLLLNKGDTVYLLGNTEQLNHAAKLLQNGEQ